MAGAARMAAQIQQDADFFSSMVHLIPQSYYAGAQQQTTDSKFTHSKSAGLAPRQNIKESSKQGVKTKAKFDPKNYTSVLSNGKKGKEDSDEEMDDSDDEEEDDEEMEDSEEEEEQPAQRKAAATAGAKKSASAASPSLSSTPTASAASSVPAPPSSLPLPPLSSLSADVGMDQLRQRLHERINGLNNQRKPQEHPFAKKRQKVDKDKKRVRNEERPSTHVRGAKPVRAEASPAAKKQKTAAAASPASSSSPSLSSRPSTSGAPAQHDVSDVNDFQFAALKALPNPAAKAGSFSLQGKLQRRSGGGGVKADEAALRDVHNFEEKVASLRASGDKETARALEQERAMANALLRVQGVKVKDDAKLLKKSLKREEKRKDKSRAEWSERTAAAKATQDAFHADKIARASKKGKGDRSKYQAPPDSDGAKGGKGPKKDKAKGGDKKGAEKPAGRAGFEGKSNKKFLN